MLVWIAENPVAVWLIAAIVLGVIEMLSLDFFCLMLSVGCLAAMVVALAVDSWTIQVIVFAIVAILLIFLVRPIIVRRLHRNTPESLSNVDRLIGQRVDVLETVTENTGLVRLAGDHWSARIADRQGRLAPGQEGIVRSIDGATAVVSAVNPQDRPIQDQK